MNHSVLMKGNEALAKAAILSGCRHFFGYPITPQTELAAYMAKHLPEHGGVFLQAESETAAINMVYGAAGAGARVMTSSSSPGISLKAEGISYIAACDLPCVLVNIMRAGPGLGGIQPSQADYFQATKGGGHGDYRMIVLAPSSVQEMAHLTSRAFHLADLYRMPVMILADGMLGQMMEPVCFDKIVSPDPTLPKKTWATTGTGMRRKKNRINSLFLNAKELEANILVRQMRYDYITRQEAKAECIQTEDADFVFVAYGTTARIVKHAVHLLRKEGYRVGLVRPITLWPFPSLVLSRLAGRVKSFIAVEMSTGQMVEDVTLAAKGKCPVSFYGRTGGIVPTPDEIISYFHSLPGGACL